MLAVCSRHTARRMLRRWGCFLHTYVCIRPQAVQADFEPFDSYVQQTAVAHSAHQSSTFHAFLTHWHHFCASLSHLSRLVLVYGLHSCKDNQCSR